MGNRERLVAVSGQIALVNGSFVITPRNVGEWVSKVEETFSDENLAAKDGEAQVCWLRLTTATDDWGETILLQVCASSEADADGVDPLEFHLNEETATGLIDLLTLMRNNLEQQQKKREKAE